VRTGDILGRKKRRRTFALKRVKRRSSMFRCPLCQHASIVIDVDRKAGIAKISCVNCGLKRTMEVGEEEELVDIYARFYDSMTEG